MTTTSDKGQQPEGVNKRSLVAFLLALPVFFALFMFLPAGTWAWAKGWLSSGCSSVCWPSPACTSGG